MESPAHGCQRCYNSEIDINEEGIDLTNSTTRLPLRAWLYLNGFTFTIFGTIAVLMTFFPVYLQSLGFDKSAVGMIMAAGPVISIIANPLWGYWSDKTRNIRRTLLIMLIGNVIMVQVIFQLSDYAWIYVAMLAFFFFQTPTFSQTTSLILHSIESSSSRFGTFRSMGSVGWAIAAVAAAPLLQIVGIGNLGMVYSIIMLLTLGLCYGLPRGGGASRSASGSNGYGKMLRNRLFVMFLLSSIMVSIPYALNQIFVTLYVTDLGGSAWVVGWSVFASAFFEVPVFLLLDRYLRKQLGSMLLLLIAVCGLFALRWTLMAYVAEAWQIVLVQGMQCITFGLYDYDGTQLTSLIVRPEYRASGQAMYTIAWNGISGIIAGFLGGKIIDVWGYQSAYKAGVVFSLIGMAMFAIIRLKSKRYMLQ